MWLEVTVVLISTIVCIKSPSTTLGKLTAIFQMLWGVYYWFKNWNSYDFNPCASYRRLYVTMLVAMLVDWASMKTESFLFKWDMYSQEIYYSFCQQPIILVIDKQHCFWSFSLFNKKLQCGVFALSWQKECVL